MAKEDWEEEGQENEEDEIEDVSAERRANLAKALSDRLSPKDNLPPKNAEKKPIVKDAVIQAPENKKAAQDALNALLANRGKAPPQSNQPPETPSKDEPPSPTNQSENSNKIDNNSVFAALAKLQLDIGRATRTVTDPTSGKSREIKTLEMYTRDSPRNVNDQEELLKLMALRQALNKDLSFSMIIDKTTNPERFKALAAAPDSFNSLPGNAKPEHSFLLILDEQEVLDNIDKIQETYLKELASLKEEAAKELSAKHETGEEEAYEIEEQFQQNETLSSVPLATPVGTTVEANAVSQKESTPTPLMSKTLENLNKISQNIPRDQEWISIAGEQAYAPGALHYLDSLWYELQDLSKITDSQEQDKAIQETLDRTAKEMNEYVASSENPGEIPGINVVANLVQNLSHDTVEAPAITNIEESIPPIPTTTAPPIPTLEKNQTPSPLMSVGEEKPTAVATTTDLPEETPAPTLTGGEKKPTAVATSDLPPETPNPKSPKVGFIATGTVTPPPTTGLLKGTPSVPTTFDEAQKPKKPKVGGGEDAELETLLTPSPSLTPMAKPESTRNIVSSSQTVKEIFDKLQNKESKLQETLGIKEFTPSGKKDNPSELKIQLDKMDKNNKPIEYSIKNQTGGGVNYSVKNGMSEEEAKAAIDNMCRLAVETAKPGTEFNIPNSRYKEFAEKQMQQYLNEAIASNKFTPEKGFPEGKVPKIKGSEPPSDKKKASVNSG